MCLSAVLVCHLLLIGWIGFNGFAPETHITPPMTGILISGGSGTSSGAPVSGNSGLAGMTPSKSSKKNDLRTHDFQPGKQKSESVSKPEQATRSESAKHASYRHQEKAAKASALSGSEITGTQSAGKGTGQDTKNGTGKSAGGTGSSGHGGNGFSGPYTDAGFFSNPKPPYPPVSRRMAEEGTVLLSVHIRTDGQVDEVKLKRSSGFARLDDSAIKTVRHWRYIPAKRNGQPIPYWYAQPIRFSLDEE